MIFGRLLVRSLACTKARSHIDSIARRINSEVPYRIEGLNVSVSREARVGRSGDSARKRRVASLLATCGAGYTVKVCRETRRARRQRRAQAEPQPDYLPIVLREDGI